MSSSLVTLIVPCYNMGNRIHRLFDSILQQTYKHLHIVVVDDGSKDNSKDVILSYIPQFEKKGYDAEYVYRENGGLGAAINTGLKHIKGEFFCWPDADDFLTPDSVEKKIIFLKSNPDYAFVRSDAALFFEDNLSEQIGCISRKSPNRFKELDLMEDYILERDIIFCPGCHMVRTASFREVNPKMDIFEGRRGQNYQMLLPLLYKFKFGYIDECLYNYIVYKDSMSRGDDSYEKWVLRYQELEDCVIETLKRMIMRKDDFEYYFDLTKQKYIQRKALKAFEFALVEEYKIQRSLLNNADLIESLRYIDRILMIPGGFYLNKLKCRLIKLLKENRIIYKMFRRQ